MGKTKGKAGDHDTEMIIRSAIALVIVAGAMLLYKLGVFNYVSKLYVDFILSDVTQKKEASPSE